MNVNRRSYVQQDKHCITTGQVGQIIIEALVTATCYFREHREILARVPAQEGTIRASNFP